MPHRSSNIPSRIFYSSIGAEVLQIGRTASISVSFVQSSKKLLFRMFKQGAHKEKVVRVLKKAYGRHEVLKPFSDTASLLACKLVG